MDTGSRNLLWLNSSKRVYQLKEGAVGRADFEYCFILKPTLLSGMGLVETPGPTRDLVHDPRFEAIEQLFVHLNYRPLGVGEKQSRSTAQVFRPQFHPSWEAKVNELLENILGDPTLGLTATDRIILLHLGQYPAGCRIEYIARCTGSRYRWIEKQVSKLTRIGLLQRVGPNTYAINSAREVQK
jgi:hypothetical protein